MSNINNILEERGRVHGNYADSAVVKDDLLAICRDAIDRYCDSIGPVGRETIRMIIEKLGRICCGRADFKDHWLDIAGYATLMVRYLDDLDADKRFTEPPINYEEGA